MNYAFIVSEFQLDQIEKFLSLKIFIFLFFFLFMATSLYIRLATKKMRKYSTFQLIFLYFIVKLFI